MLLVKSIVYRFFRVVLLFLVSFFVLGDTSVAMSISAIDMILATAYYYAFEKLWNCSVRGRSEVRT